ncbi:DUF2812 domain-containing protein [Acetanaerobacterium elongatum]|uniref:DUF2812 domain-containing protein n=1 Tax=Acetanaerobacterium elongatum TaxID=258515 RepID=A0A1H0E2V7_9FIRM|nr:DUF2812 domain-containing protein [Acetanaerobacterium elongatum]SDN76720.1 Protein of unknown function [Acetanaerobacterium elongatum]
MKQFKIFIDFAKEEQYLNSQAKKGCRFFKSSCLGFYHFVNEAPKDTNYRIDYRVFKNQYDFNNYVTMFEDSGWRHVYGTKYSGRQYFLPVRENAAEDIFSDITSKAQRYISFQRQCIVSLVLLSVYSYITIKPLNSPIFLTPGLWEKQGSSFWLAFLIELPFALMRVLPMFLFLAAAIFNGCLAIMARRSYKRFLAETKEQHS